MKVLRTVLRLFLLLLTVTAVILGRKGKNTFSFSTAKKSDEKENEIL